MTKELKKKSEHGGDIYNNEVIYDLSVNINPFGPPESARQAVSSAMNRLVCYPEYDKAGLKTAAAECYGVSADNIICGNGVSELLTAIGRICRNKRVLIPVPCYTGYEKAFRENDIVFHYLKREENFLIGNFIAESMEDTGAEAVIFGNPANPSGGLADRDVLIKLIDWAKKNGILFIIDESFIELSDIGEHGSIIDIIYNYDNLIILRSVTKAYAVPGVRLGFAISSNKELLKQIERELSEWNISVFAEETGRAIFADPLREKYLEDSGRLILRLRRELEEHLQKAGIDHIPSESNFVLLNTDRDLYNELLEKKILIRDCRNVRGLGANWYRIAVKEPAGSIVF